MEEYDLAKGGKRIKFDAVFDGYYTFADEVEVGPFDEHDPLDESTNIAVVCDLPAINQESSDHSSNNVKLREGTHLLSYLLEEIEQCGAAPVLPDG